MEAEGLEVGGDEVDGLEVGTLPVEGRVVGELEVVGRVPPGWPKPRSAEGLRAGAVLVPMRFCVPALTLPGEAEGRPCELPGAVPALFP